MTSKFGDANTLVLLATSLIIKIGNLAFVLYTTAIILYPEFWKEGIFPVQITNGNVVILKADMEIYTKEEIAIPSMG